MAYRQYFSKQRNISNKDPMHVPFLRLLLVYHEKPKTTSRLYYVFYMIRDAHQNHYEQFGIVKGTFKIGEVIH
jgi:hypothetical protein